MTKKLLTLLLSLVLISACSGDSLPMGVPPASAEAKAQATLSWWSRAAIDAYLRYSVWKGERSGFVTLFAQDGVPIYANAVGWKDIDSQEPMALDTPMRFASMTKPVTAVAAMMLIEQGRLNLDDPVANYIPAYASPRVVTSETPDAQGEFPTRPAATPLLVRHLLMFSSGIGPGRAGIVPGGAEESPLIGYWNENGIRSLERGTLEDRVDHIAQLPLFEEPGTRWRYGWSADVLARVVEVASEQSISEFMAQYIFQPLGMDNTQYRGLLLKEDLQQLATVYTQDENGDLVLAPLPFDDEWTPGGSGLVSTAGDYMRFALMLWNGGEYQGARILKQETIEQMVQLHMPEGVLAASGIDGLGWGLGMAVVADADVSRIPGRNGDFWWAGYYGTTFFVSPDTGLVGVVLSQNEPSEFSGLPVQVYVVQGLAYAGLD